MVKSQRDALIDSGLTLFHARGYANTGAREIAAAAGVPQGSFTNHFRSKEGLGVAVLDRYFERLEGVMDDTLSDGSRHPIERLNAYFDAIEARLSDAGWSRGCLIADLAAEIPVHSDQIRRRLMQIVRSQSIRFEAVLGEACTGEDRADFGAFVIAAWHGALLRMKVERSSEPLRSFRRTLNRLVAGSRPA